MLFCRGQQRNVPKFKNIHAEQLFFFIKLIVLWRCHCCSHRRCLKFPIGVSEETAGGEYLVSEWLLSLLCEGVVVYLLLCLTLDPGFGQKIGGLVMV